VNDRAEPFRRLYQDLRIADQAAWYTNRSAEYMTAHAQAITVRNVLLFAAALSGLVLQLLEEGSGRAVFGVIAAVLAAMAGGLTAYEGLIGFDHLSKLYGDAAHSLAEAELDWEAAGAGGDIAADVKKVERIFRIENGQWGQLVLESVPKELPAQPVSKP
jgi:hypothetical protein